MQIKMWTNKCFRLHSLLIIGSYLSIILQNHYQTVNCRHFAHIEKRDAPTLKLKSEISTSSSGDKAFEGECLRQHNKWRKLHRASPLKIDPKLVEFAQKRADFIAKSDGDEFRHPDDLDYGENLAWHSDSTTNCAKLIKMWYDEVKLYSYKEAVFSHETGHFTQLVWRDTKRVGCARAFSSGPRGGIYLVCNYDPAGNWRGEYQQNVLKAKKLSKKSKNKKKDKKKQQQQKQDNANSTTSTTTTTTSTRKPAN